MWTSPFLKERFSELENAWLGSIKEVNDSRSADKEPSKRAFVALCHTLSKEMIASLRQLESEYSRKRWLGVFRDDIWTFDILTG